MYLSSKTSGRFLYDLPAPKTYRLNDGELRAGSPAGGSNIGTEQQRASGLRIPIILNEAKIGATKKDAYINSNNINVQAPYDEGLRTQNQYTNGNGGSSNSNGSNGGNTTEQPKKEETNWLLYGGIAVAGLAAIYLITG